MSTFEWQTWCACPYLTEIRSFFNVLIFINQWPRCLQQNRVLNRIFYIRCCATYRCNSWYAPPPPQENFDLSFSEMLCGEHVFARPFPIMQMKLAFYAPHNSCLIPKKCSNYTRFSKNATWVPENALFYFRQNLQTHASCVLIIN